MTKKIAGTFFFDFDSTLHPHETLNEILKQGLEASSPETIAKIDEICKQGMSGEISVANSIEQRLSLANLTNANIDKYIKSCPKIEQEVVALIDYLMSEDYAVYIISNGFVEIISKICDKSKLKVSAIFGNCLVSEKNLIKFDLENSELVNGKKLFIAKLRSRLMLARPIVIVGDSITDLEAKDAAAADYGVHWQSYVKRSIEPAIADLVIKSNNDLVAQFAGLLNKMHR